MKGAPVFCRKKLRQAHHLLTKTVAEADYTILHQWNQEEYGMIAALNRRERVTIQENIRIPELYRQKLIHYAESFQDLAKSLDTMEYSGRQAGENDRRDILEEQKSAENRLLISHNLCEVARIMNSLADELSHCRPIEERHRKMLIHALRAESIYGEQFCYITEGEDDTRAMSVILHTDRRGGCQAAQVANMMSVLLNRKLQLSAASPYMVGQEPRSFVFVEEPKYVALTGFCKVTKENEPVSGDHYSILESEKGRMSLILSDGTGSGEQASKDSERVLDLMEKLLEAGYEREAAADMVNVAFFAGGREYSHPTLDICDLNLYDGQCYFCKVGGAASFLKRGHRMEMINHGNLPLGIFRNVDVNTTTRTLSNGDYVILMTDGVLDAFGEEDYETVLTETVGDMEDVCPGELAEKIMEAALVSCGGRIQDDMTVLVAGIWENATV